MPPCSFTGIRNRAIGKHHPSYRLIRMKRTDLSWHGPLMTLRCSPHCVHLQLAQAENEGAFAPTIGGSSSQSIFVSPSQVSVPSPPSTLSSPRSPSNTSSPPAPARLSAPDPPHIALGPSSPMIVSAYGDPVMSSKLLSVSEPQYSTAVPSTRSTTRSNDLVNAAVSVPPPPPMTSSPRKPSMTLFPSSPIRTSFSFDPK